jgi:hypothetical protein
MTDDDGGGDVGVNGLLVQPVNPPRFTAARSLAEAAAGETVMFNRRGQTLNPRQVRAAKVVAWAKTVATLIGCGAIVGLPLGWTLSSPLAGVIAGIAFDVVALYFGRHVRAFRVALAQGASYRWEEAHATLVGLEGKPLSTGLREMLQVRLANLELLIGQPQQAIDRLARAQADLSTGRGNTPLRRCQVAGVRAGALAALGRIDEARTARDELMRAVADATGPGNQRRGDYTELLVQEIELDIAAAAETPEALPDDDTLHRWARAALGRTSFGEMLVSLAWAFHRRGDDDMARHLLAEAPSRIPRSSLENTAPKLAAWAKTTAQVWGIQGY